MLIKDLVSEWIEIYLEDHFPSIECKNRRYGHDSKYFDDEKQQVCDYKEDLKILHFNFNDHISILQETIANILNAQFTKEDMTFYIYNVLVDNMDEDIIILYNIK